MLLHLRIVSPPDRTDRVVAVVVADEAAANVAVLRGASLAPGGDLVLCDVAREAVNGVLDALQHLDVHIDGSIAVEHIEVALGRSADAAEARARGEGTEAAVWAQVAADVRDLSAFTVSFAVFLVIAGLLAAVGLAEDSPILIVGAMIVGPEFGPISGLSVGLFTRRASLVRTAATTLATGLTVGLAAVGAATAFADAAHLVPGGFSAHAQPLTGFVVHPSALSFAVAVLAGTAGTLSLTEARAGTLIGVLISVTTIPAVAAMGMSGALGEWHDLGAAAAQLALNIAGLVIAGVVTLWVQRRAWELVLGPPRRVARHSPRRLR